MTVVCVLVEGAETRAQNDSLQHACQVVPVSSLHPIHTSLSLETSDSCLLGEREAPLSSLLTQRRVTKPLPFQVMGYGREGEQKASDLAAGQERGGCIFLITEVHGSSPPLPSPLAGSDVNGLPASVLPLHHKHPLS